MQGRTRLRAARGTRAPAILRGTLRFLLGALCLAIVLGVVLHWTGQRQLAATRAELEAISAHFPPAEALGVRHPFQPQAPENQALLDEIKAWNKAWPFISTSSVGKRELVRDSLTLGDEATEWTWPIKAHRSGSPSWAEVEEALAPLRPRIEEARDALLAKTPAARRSDPTGMLFATWFNELALADLHAGRLASLADWIAVMPYPNSDLVWEGLQHPGWTEADLARLAAAWDRFDPVAFESRMVIENMRQRPPRALEPFFEDGRLNLSALSAYAFGDWLQIADLQWMEIQLRDVVALRQGVSYQELPAQLGSPQIPWLDRLLLSRKWNNGKSVANWDNGYCLQQAQADLTRTAIALARYRAVYGSYPATLDPLAPTFLAKVPRDPFDGAPLRYRLRADGTFLLYSVGREGKEPPLDAAGQVGPLPAGSTILFWPGLKG